MNPSVTILSTKKLETADIINAENYGITIFDEEFIQTEICSNYLVQEALSRSQPHLVFTSAKAVEGYIKNCVGLPETMKYIFCLQGETLKSVAALKNYMVKGTAENAAALATLIAEKKETHSVSFICGNLRRDELPLILKNNKIEVEETEVYKTTITPKTINRKYDGVMFFSPSGAESFFSSNTLAENIPCFCIGNTTAEAVKEKTNNKIITACEPSRQSLLETMAEYYSIQIKTSTNDNSTGKRNVYEEQ